MKKLPAISLLFAVLWVAISGFAQTAVLMPVPEQPFSYNGAVLANGFVYTYFTGGFTPAPNFTDFTGLVQNTNPVQLNAGGFPSTSLGLQCGIWLQPATQYRIVVQNSAHIQIYQIDGVAGLVPSVSSGSVSSVTATAPIASSGGTAPNISASVSGGGSNLATTNVGANTNNDIVQWDGSGNLKDSATLLASLAPLASPTFTGTVTIPANTEPFSIMTGGSNGQCAVKVSGVWQPASCAGTAGTQVLSVNTTKVTVNANVNTNQNLMAYTLIGGTLNNVGHGFEAVVYGTVRGANTSNSINMQVLLGGSQIYIAQGVPINSATNIPVKLEVQCYTVTTGATGTLDCVGSGAFGTGQMSTVAWQITDPNGSYLTLDLTVNETLQVVFQGLVASTLNVGNEDLLRVSQLVQ